MTIAIVEPHYDDAWINLGGYILKNQDEQFLIVSFSDDPANNKNETRKLGELLPNVKTVTLNFKGIPWSMRDQIIGNDLIDFFVKKNKKTLFNRRGVENFTEVEDRVNNVIAGCRKAVLPCGARHPQHLVVSRLKLAIPVQYYLEFPYPYNRSFADLIPDLPKTVIDITDVLQEKIKIFETTYISQLAMLKSKSPKGLMEEVNSEIIVEQHSLLSK